MPIPKILHYCWFGGGAYSKVEKKCMKTWEKFFKEYNVIKWDETNFDVHINPYVEEAYNAKKFMYVSDYARLKALYDYGGLYLDVDCFVKKSFDNLMDKEVAFTGIGCDNKELAACTLAFSPKDAFIKECLDSYDGAHFILEDGSFDTCSVNIRMTRLLMKHGFVLNGKEQVVNGIHIYPMTYFCPYSLMLPDVPDCKSKKTYSISIFDTKDFKRERRLYMKLGRKLGLDKLKRRIFGVKNK